jgi:predicted phosphodiesterase
MIDWNILTGKVITVISDLHSNKRAIKAALELVKQKRTDQLIILGDILTYGIDVQETIDMINREITDGAILLKGNHDEVYLDLITGTNKMYNGFRKDLKESIDYNLNILDTKLFSSWPWGTQFICDNIYFSHANPYGDCWEYVNDIYDFQAAARKIKKMGHLAGVFGHSHRSKCFSLKTHDLQYINEISDDIFILNPGSVGQPREKPIKTSLMRLSSHNNKLWAEIELVKYDMQEHVNDLINSTLSDTTKTILVSFFKE